MGRGVIQMEHDFRTKKGYTHIETYKMDISSFTVIKKRHS